MTALTATRTTPQPEKRSTMKKQPKPKTTKPRKGEPTPFTLERYQELFPILLERIKSNTRVVTRLERLAGRRLHPTVRNRILTDAPPKVMAAAPHLAVAIAAEQILRHFERIVDHE
jgi:hypothetical protein